MKKLFSCLCVIALLLAPLYASAEAAVVSQHDVASQPYMGYGSNTYVLRTDEGFQVFNADGQSVSSVYPSMGSAQSGAYYTFSTSGKITENGLMDAAGQVIFGEEYFGNAYPGGDWILGIVMEETADEKCDYTSKQGVKLNMVRADVLYKGQMIGSLNRDQYLPTCGTGAFGDYLYIQFEDGFCLFFDKELNQINDFVVSDGKPSEYMESDGTYYHLPTLRKAFVSGSTVTADEVSDSVKAIDGNIVDLQGNVLCMLPEGVQLEEIVSGKWLKIRSQNGYGLMNLQGNVVIPAEYMSLAEGAGEPFFANGYQAAYSAEGQVCFFDMAGNVTASSAKGVGYLMMEGFSYNSPIIGIEGEEGYTLFSAVKGELTEVYDDVDTWYTSQPVISVEKNGLWGCVDMMGNQVIPFVFSGIPDISNDGTLVIGETAESVYTVYKLAY